MFGFDAAFTGKPYLWRSGMQLSVPFKEHSTAKQLEVDFSIVTLSGHIWEAIRYAVAKEEVYYLFI